MARKARPLKSSFWDDDKVCHLSRDARLTLAGIITKMADDEGRFVATPAAIGGELYPYDELSPSRIKRWLSEIEAEGMVTVYRVNGGTYGALRTWRRHQKPPHPTPSTIPPPSEEALFS
jgi:hypothetical protein